MEEVLRIVEPQKASYNSTKEQLPRKCVELHQNLFVDSVPESKNWVKDVFPNAAIYRGFDELLWGYFIIAVYKSSTSSKLNSLIMDKLGTTHYDAVNISRKSRFYPAVENLSPTNRESSVRKCIAVSLLQKFADLDPILVPKLQPQMKYDYDPTAAGDLANNCQLIGFCPPGDIGKSLDCLGLLRPRYSGSLLLDVVYEHKESAIEANNELVFHLGDQLEQLFDPLTEYSPEQTEIIYKSPEGNTLVEKDDTIVSMICNEMLQVQTNFTLTLVEFLQKFLIPLRIEVANEEIAGLSIPKLNRLFPPTIDEVTRINCIFLDALKASHSYGSQELLKACSVTIPYFYKAYTRHDAATKDFSKQLKEFLAKFHDALPGREFYTQMKIDAIIKSPQETILKIKLIIDRLWSTKKWALGNAHLAEAHYLKICDIIDSFGADEKPLKSYNTRVFTPSGKLLTELARGWPTELQYNWLKRRVVGVFDVMDSNDNTQRNILVIFSDYIVILNVIDTSSYYDSYAGKKPLLSDVLMNSLINEVPLPPKVPELRVANYFYVNDVAASTFGTDMIRIDHLNSNNVTAVAAKIISSSLTGSEVVNLIAKAKILEKETAFHLFRYTDEDLQVFSTAHEVNAYAMERIRSRFSLFLNMNQNQKVLKDYNLVVAFFASLEPDGTVALTELTCDGREKHFTVELQNLVRTLVSEFTTLYSQFYSTARSPFLSELLEINSQLVKRVGHHFSEDAKLAPTLAEDNSPAGTFPLLISRPESLPITATLKSAKDDLSHEIKPSEERTQQSKKKRAEGKELDQKHQVIRKNSETLLLTSKQKRRSIIGRISGLFTKKKDLKSKKVISDSTRGARRITAAANVEGGTKGSNSSHTVVQRMSSIIHVPLSTNSIDEKASISTTETSVKRSRGFHEPHSLSDKVSSKDGTPLSASEKHLDDDRMSPSQNRRFYGVNQEERESKLFNQDLYGDAYMGAENEDQLMVAKSRSDNSSVQRMPSPSERLTRIAQPPSVKPGASELLKTSRASPNDRKDHEEFKSSREATDAGANINHEDVRRKDIFPEIKKLGIGSSQFVRSPSFTEFFENMRLVLDESDESSNWKTLPSEMSPKSKQNAIKDGAASHAFSRFVPFNRRATAAEASLSQFPQKSADVPPATTLEAPDYVGPSNFQVNEPLGIQSSASRIINVTESAPEPPSPSLKGKSGFKVVHHTSPKLISFNPNSTTTSPERKEWQPVERHGKNSIMATTPGDGCQNMSLDSFSNGEVADGSRRQANSQSSSSIDRKDGLGEARMALISYTPSEREQSPTGRNATTGQLLNDPDFSSFHMSFSGNDETFDSSRYDQPSTMGPRTILEQPPVDTAPIFYRLPAIERSTDTFFTCTDGTTGKGGFIQNAHKFSESEDLDDAMWISPSKLDMFDLSKQPESVFAQISLKTKRRYIEEKRRNPNPIDSPQEQALLPDSSYAYLRGLLVHTDDEDDAEDSEPTRLTFYK
ncbi:Bud3p LALA0_S03e09560g [Lachancea lanzarotensis]|uniref:LALA0S03e09560g1_1 n=1 Tax=Lachancea lanzarotensis TaxID=1245769 RepID=A0A0C7MPB1_9SACH|nr:uncharacterized protein LALA0_S03e09560g [Lachancea lanzarotensis]CEP61729.1 LALA0S03e09560g1_1 [Lachancea lanzarotensis]